MELEELAGKHILSGIEVGSKRVERWFSEKECNYIKVTLDGATYLALEDPDDGYRSYMEELQIVEDACKIKLPDIEVVCTMRENLDDWRRSRSDDVLVFIDSKNGKKILAVGTANNDDYYPWCVLEYTPENMSCNEARRAGNE